MINNIFKLFNRKSKPCPYMWAQDCPLDLLIWTAEVSADLRVKYDDEFTSHQISNLEIMREFDFRLQRWSQENE